MIYLMQISTYLHTVRRSLQLRDDLSSDLYALQFSYGKLCRALMFQSDESDHECTLPH